MPDNDDDSTRPQNPGDALDGIHINVKNARNVNFVFINAAENVSNQLKANSRPTDKKQRNITIVCALLGIAITITVAVVAELL